MCSIVTVSRQRKYSDWANWMVLVALAMGFGAAAGAQEPPRRELVEYLAEHDRDGDGLLQRAEAPFEIISEFQQADLNRDGAIDSFEAWKFDSTQARAGAAAEPEPAFEPTPKERSAPRRGENRKITSLVDLVEMMDENGDQRLVWREVPEEMRKNFTRMDLNRDGFVDLEEARELDQRREGTKSASEDTGRFIRLVRMNDTDGDGRLQKKEAPLRLQGVFHQFDSNRDGAIDLDEAKRGQERINRRRAAEK